MSPERIEKLMKKKFSKKDFSSGQKISEMKKTVLQE
jgi:hypothetical protein